MQFTVIMLVKTINLKEKTMKAIRVHEFGAPEVMILEELDAPVPGAGEVLVRLAAIGVNPVDTYIRSGLYRPDLKLPYTPGFDGAGVIAAVGPDVHHRQPGQRVYISWSLSGTYAEQVLCRENQTYSLPDSVSYAQGAAMGVPYGAAFRALFHRAHAVAGESVLINGASGGVGIAAVQLARAAGLQVIGTAGSDRGRELVLSHGAHHTVNHHDPDYLDALKEITSGLGVDIILEMLATVNLGRYLQLLAKGGSVVIVGSRGTVEINPRDAMLREVAILGMTLFNAIDKEQKSMHAALVAGLRSEE